MKILHVLPGLTRGGAERVAVDLANEQARRDHDVTLLTLYVADPALAPAPLDPRIQLRSILTAARSHRSAYPRLLSWAVRNRRFILEQDVVHVHLTGPAVFGSIVQLLRGLFGGRGPVVIETYHAVGMAIPAWKRGLHGLLLKGRDGVALMAEDEYWRKFSTRHGDRLVQLIPNGVSRLLPVNEPARKAFRELAGIPSDVRLVGSLGRLERERRPDALLQAFAEAARILPQSVHFLFGGEGPARTELESLADMLGIGNRIHFCGLVHEPAAFLGHLDLYITVNVGPITGIAALEAAMSGLPVIAFQMSPLHASGASDWIWSSSDPSGIGQRLAWLMSDEDARRALAQSQQTYAQMHHSVDAMAPAYHELYKAAVSRKREPSDAHW